MHYSLQMLGIFQRSQNAMQEGWVVQVLWLSREAREKVIISSFLYWNGMQLGTFHLCWLPHLYLIALSAPSFYLLKEVWWFNNGWAVELCHAVFTPPSQRDREKTWWGKKKKSPQKLMGWNKEQLNNNNNSKVKAMLKQEERNYSLPPISK